MIRVQFLVRTTWEGKRCLPGDDMLVSFEVADRWAARGIAKVVGGEVSPPPKDPAKKEETKEDDDPALRKPVLKLPVVPHRVGTSSWYDLKRGDEVLDRVLGKANAEKRAVELEQESQP